MATTVKVRKIGNSVGIVLSKEIIARLRIKSGEMLHVCETPNGIELTPYDPEFAAQMEIAESIMREDRNVLRKLAQ